MSLPVLSREKYGVAPAIEVYLDDELVQANQSIWITGIEGFIAFILGELLKNSAVHSPISV